MKNIRVLLADDHQLVRAGMRALIDSLPGFEVAGEAADGREVLRLAREDGIDLVVMDLSMPGLNGLDATARIAKDHPEIRVVVLSMHTSENYVLDALRAGARGYVIKDSAPEELERALRAVAAGQRYLSPAISHFLLDDYLRLARGGADPQKEAAQLTARQREILQLIAEGRSTREIAGRLSISIKTVETHRAQIMQRLDVRDVASLTRYAIRLGLITPDS
ncbi:MAG: response regulator transcription factor [Zoogloeaceae bacterium]|nr:response regulator transcription factor [Zoogloeaceae bacterium]MCK6385870.1 response regulator transcription factor [Rhodocyclaceae bacterium]